MVESIVIEDEWNLRYRYSAGLMGSRFLCALRDECQLYASTCEVCARVIVPPRMYCEICFAPTTGWHPVGPNAVIEAFTIVMEQFDGLPPPPYAIAYAIPERASTALVNFVEGIDLSDVNEAVSALAVGNLVKASFRSERRARITDFCWRLA